MTIPFLLGLLALSIPVAFTLAAASRGDPFDRAALASGWSLFQAIGIGIGWALVSSGEPLVIRVLPGTDLLGVRIDGSTVVMLGLVSLVAFVIVRFSRSLLQGDRGRDRYARWLSGTLAAVSLLVASNHLLVIALAWVGSSLLLHPLLTHFADRPAAALAAREKFLVSRCAELFLFGGVFLVGIQTGTLSLDGLAAFVSAHDRLPPTLHVAALLFAGCAVIKCAQPPFHGWMTRVMEAPTPVSALLHAGVVNIGGFVLIRLAPLMVGAPAAQTLLVAIGCATAVVAGLVATTRVSIKVALAWSTIAQMGFMLMQCGLGAYSLALLHLAAHSLYKAHAFLSSGSAVERWAALRLASPKRPVGLGRWFGAGAVSLLGVATVAAAFGAPLREEPALAALGWVLALALPPLLVGTARSWAAAWVVPTVYFGWHALFAELLASPVVVGSLGPRLVIVVLAFAVAFVVQGVLQAHPEGVLARASYPHLFDGLSLDRPLTRVTTRLWPVRAVSVERSLHLSTPSES